MRKLFPLTALFAFAWFPLDARAANADPELRALRAQVQALEPQLKVLSRQLELKEDTAATAAPAATYTAWQCTTSYVLTGEDSSYHGVAPRVNFAPAAAVLRQDEKVFITRFQLGF